MPSSNSAADKADRQTTAFLSYARADVPWAEKLVAALEQAGVQVWWDGLIEAGEAYASSIESALDEADAVIVLWSKSSIHSDWVLDEAARGRDRKCLVPLSVDGREPPLGWRGVGVAGSKQECLAHIETVWTDMRPLSLRRAMDGTSS